MQANGPLHNGKRLTWCIFFHFCLKKLGIFLQNIQSRDGATRATLQWRGRPEAVLLKKGPSRSWRRTLRASAGALKGVFWAAQWYVALILFELRVLVPCNCRQHRVVHSDSQKVPRRYITQFGWMSPKKVGSLVWFLVCLGFFAFSRLLLGKISHYRRDTIDLFKV